MCLACRINLPLTGFERSPKDNDMLDRLQGLARIEQAVAYFHYRRSSPQAALIHDMKYHGHSNIGRQLAREYSRTLLPLGFFNTIDAIVPVPLSFWRHCRRGFNQSAVIAQGIADTTSLPIIDALRAKSHRSQTRRNAADRRTATRGIFSARPDALSGAKHVLLVDDICTTGATLHACATALNSAHPSLQISVFTLAATTRL